MHRLLKMNVDEFRKFVPLFFLNFLLTSGFFLARTAKDAMFFSEVGAGKLPIAFLLNALLIFILGGWISKVQDRMPLKKIMMFSWLITAICSLGFGLLFGAGIPKPLGLLPYFAFFAFFEIPYLTLTSLFWTFSEGYFTERQQDKVFPKITGGAHIGTTFAGFLAIFAIPFIGTAGLIFAWAIMLGFGFFIIMWMWKKGKPEFHSDPEIQRDGEDQKEGGLTAGLQAVLRHKYAILFLFITFCTFFVMSVFDYSLADTSRTVLGNDTEKLTVYLGWITAIFGIVAFFAQIFVVPKLMNRLGVATTNLIAPALLTIGGGVLLTIYNFSAAAIARGLFLVNEFVFNQTLLPFIYGAVPEKDRNQIRSTIEGTVTNVALAIAGIFLIFPSIFEGFKSHWIGMVAFLAAVVMLGLSWVLRKEYISIREIRYEEKDSTGRLQYLKSLAELGDDSLDKTLRDDLTSNSEPSIILALHFIKDQKRTKLLETVLSLANESKQEIRLTALATLEVLIESNNDFENFINALRYPASDEGYRRFRTEDAPTLEAISKVYLATGKASQLGNDLEYILFRKGYDPEVQGLAARYIIKSGAYAPIKKGFEALDSALQKKEISEKIKAADIIGELGYDSKHFEQLIAWTEAYKEGVEVIKEEVKQELKRLRIKALEAIVKIGKGSRLIAEKSFDIVYSKLKDAELSQYAMQGALKIVAAHPMLIGNLKSILKEEEKNIDDLSLAMAGNLPKLPKLLLDVNISESEAFLLEMVNDSEHQISRQSLSTICSCVRRQDAVLSVLARNKCFDLVQNLFERLCLCAKIRSSIPQKLKRYDFARDALSFRMKDIFQQYCNVTWLSSRTKDNAERLDLSMERINSGDISLRDSAIKSLELIFKENRNVYLELSELIDALDEQKGEEESEKIFSQIALRKGYGWQKDSIEDSINKLIKLKKDVWISWVFEDIAVDSNEQKDEIKTPDFFEEALNALFNTSPFLDVPTEFLAQLALQSEVFSRKKGDRLLYEGRSEQGILVVLEGQSLKVMGNQPVDSVSMGPKVWGQFASIAKQPLTYGVRVTDAEVKALRINHEAVDYWLGNNPQAALKISRSLVKDIELYNEQEKSHKAEQEGIQKFSNQLSKLQSEIQQVISGTDSRETINRVQKRFLINPVDEKELQGLTSKVLEQYYLIIEENHELRLRSENDQNYKMTLKDKEKGEVTLGVDSEVYTEMEKFQVGRTIRKTRYKFQENANSWTLDIYDKNSPFKALVIAEIELPDSKSTLPEPPAFFDIQVNISGLSDFENKNLALYGPPDLAFVSRWNKQYD